MRMLGRTILLFPLAAVALIFLAGCASGPPPSAIDLELFERYRALPRAGDGTGIVAPKAIRRVDPQMPLQYVRSGQSRSATVEMAIGTDGRVMAVWYLSGDRQWAQVVADAFRQWEFEPATRDGEPVAVRIELTSRFKSNPVRW
ncbi:MAG: energy transducer TonB [Acidobacteria bacterium]|nr:energy transducer TonB [Acidobacteriota bacterium]